MVKNNLLYIVFDSCRYDTFVAARTPHISRLGKVERRYSFASWTLPSHAVYMMGASPHKNTKGVFASEVYKKDFLNWGDRLGIPGATFGDFVPQLSLPAYLKERGYSTHALVSMPVLNQLTFLNKHFDRYELMDRHDDFASMLNLLRFQKDTPSYYLMNVGETHYPFTVAGESDFVTPVLHGERGLFKHSGESPAMNDPNAGGDAFYHMDRLAALKEKQRLNVEHLDRLFGKLYDLVPSNTHIIVTADHGELFGEEGFFGHGPVFHEKVFEVFFVEGKKP